MPGNTFLNFNDKSVVGESLQKGFKGDPDGWIEVSDWSWDIEAETSFMKGGGSAVGKPQPGNFSITHYYDTSSASLMNRIVQGTTFDNVEIVQLKQTGSGAPEAFLVFTFKNVFITKVSTKGGEDGSVTQDVEMVFKEVAFAYRMQENLGALSNKPGFFSWNIAEMNETTSMGLPNFSKYKTS